MSETMEADDYGLAENAYIQTAQADPELTGFYERSEDHLRAIGRALHGQGWLTPAEADRQRAIETGARLLLFKLDERWTGSAPVDFEPLMEALERTLAAVRPPNFAAPVSPGEATPPTDDEMAEHFIDAKERMGEALVAIGMALGLPAPRTGATWGAPEILAKIAAGPAPAPPLRGESPDQTCGCTFHGDEVHLVCAEHHRQDVRDAEQADRSVRAERASMISEIEWALFGSEDGEIVSDDSALPVGELRRLLREVWADPTVEPRCQYCGADCSDGRSWDGGNLYACPACADARAADARAAVPAHPGVARPDEGAALIAAERARQTEAEGWTPEHDDQHVGQQLAWAAACYAAPSTVYRVRHSDIGGFHPGGQIDWWEPWPSRWRRPEVDRIRALVKAGALIAAEIDRLQRLDDLAEQARTAGGDES